MRAVYTGDLHLTDREEDDYRWDFLDWLTNWVLDHEVDYLFLLGDLTDKKDKHSSLLVNRLIDWLLGLNQDVVVRILKGNHDYTDPANPFFRFVDSVLDSVHYCTTSRRETIGDLRYLYLPHTSDPHRDWIELEGRFGKYDRILMHQVLSGARAANGHTLSGVHIAHYLRGLKRGAHILAGDVHVPQRVGKVEYVGSPYPIKFGDTFIPRILVEEDGEFHEVHPPHPRKEVIEITNVHQIEGFEFKPGDMVKVVMRLPRAMFPDWDKIRSKIRKRCESFNLRGIELRETKRVRLRGSEPESTHVATLTPEELFEEFAGGLDIDDHTREMGERLVKA